jgi:ATP-binding cassette subfamily B protein
MDYFFYQGNETGDLISRCTNDLNQVRTLLGPGVMYIPNSLSRLILFLPVLIQLSGPLMLILGFIMTFLVIIIVVLLPLLRPHFLRIQEAMGTMNNRVWQVISGISTIKQYTAEGIEVERFKTLNEDYIKKQMAVVKLQEFLRPFFFFIFSITELVILWVGGKQVINGQMTIGQLLQFNIMISYLTFPILALGWMMSLMQQGISAMGRINYILDQPEEDRERKKQLLADELEFYIKNLTYQYPGFAKEVLKNINLTVMFGQTIGITGQVGSGKSTLLNILTGLIKPDPGQVFVNGTDICEIDPQSLFRKVAVVSQDPFLFSRTVAENIALGPEEMSMEAIRKAAEDAGLKKDIQSFHDGFSQEVGERGITLSGGQKQRIAIARALGKCAPLLVLDDPLSNIDARTETRILKNLQSLHCYQTLIVVSHRISVLKTADVIYVLDDGTIVEQGTHRSLVRRKNGLYARLAKLQQMEMELEE